MGIPVIVIIWAVILYIIKLHRDLAIYKEYYQRTKHKDIYVQSFSELQKDYSIEVKDFINVLNAVLRRFTEDLKRRFLAVKPGMQNERI